MKTALYVKPLGTAELEDSETRPLRSLQGGLLLDTARFFYPLSVLKKFVTLVKESGGSYLQLHFSDTQNYAIESTLLGQVPNEDNKRPDGSYTNPNTGKPFYSASQLKELFEHAAVEGVELIPEVDVPAHCETLLELYKLKYGNEAYLKFKSTGNDIRYSQKENVQFLKKLFSEVITLFGGRSVKRFHIGGDEFGFSEDWHWEYVNFVNEISGYLEGKGIKTRIWNDALINRNLVDFNHSLEVTFWSWDGDKQDTEEQKRLKAQRASAPELIREGFNIVNCNSYYSYFVPQGSKGVSALKSDAAYAANDATANWGIRLWEGQNKASMLQSDEGLAGAMACIWGEDIGSLTAEQVFEITSPFIRAIISKVSA